MRISPHLYWLNADTGKNGPEKNAISWHFLRNALLLVIIWRLRACSALWKYQFLTILQTNLIITLSNLINANSVRGISPSFNNEIPWNDCEIPRKLDHFTKFFSLVRQYYGKCPLNFCKLFKRLWMLLL